MRIGILSDTHIPDRAFGLPQVMLEAFEQVDMVIHAGDLVDISVIESLKTVCKNIKMVYGNMDPEEVRSVSTLKEVIQVGKYRIGIMHGWGHPGNLIDLMVKEFKDQQVDLVVFGHSHAPINQKIGGIIYFNPGSPTDKIFSPYNSYGIIEINDVIEAKIVRI